MKDTVMKAQLDVLLSAASVLQALEGAVDSEELRKRAHRILHAWDEVTKGRKYKCPLCGSRLHAKRSYEGNSFLGCSRYPECKHTESIDEAVRTLFYPKKREAEAKKREAYQNKNKQAERQGDTLRQYPE